MHGKVQGPNEIGQFLTPKIYFLPLGVDRSGLVGRDGTVLINISKEENSSLEKGGEKEQGGKVGEVVSVHVQCQ